MNLLLGKEKWRFFMKHFKYIIFLPALLFLVNCITQPADPVVPIVTKPAKSAPAPRPESYYIEKAKRDLDKAETLARAKNKRDRGPTCEGDDDCEEICDDIYRSRRDQNDCEEFSVAQVERFEEIYEILEDPDEDDLQDIDVSEDGDFDAFINISIEPLHKLVGKYSSREAKDFLAWIANNEDVAERLEDEDDDYEVLDALLDELNTEAFTALATNIDSSDNFMDLAVVASNEKALEWIHEYLESEHDNCSSDTNTNKEACLTHYCALGADMDDDNAEDLLGDYEYFQDYIDDIISDEIFGDTSTAADGDTRESGHWDADEDSDNYIEEYDDIDGDWWRAPTNTGGGICP